MLCPYLIEANRRNSTITCEGVVPGSSITSHFAGGPALRQAISRFCEGDCASCPWYQIMTARIKKATTPAAKQKDVFRY